MASLEASSLRSLIFPIFTFSQQRVAPPGEPGGGNSGENYFVEKYKNFRWAARGSEL
jgi:hypothetical protein